MVRTIASLAYRTGMVVRVEVQRPMVALTFDDGPDAETTPRVLDVLARHGAHATFFVDGPAAQRNSNIVQRIVDEGHEVGLHGWSHTSAEEPQMSGLRSQLREIRRAKQAVKQPAHLYRPPYGHESGWTRIAAAAERMQLVYWNASAVDWQITPVSELSSRISALLKPGAIVLMHDRLRTAVDPAAFDRSFMIESLSRALTLSGDALMFVTVSELMAAGKPVIRRRRQVHGPLAAMVEQIT